MKKLITTLILIVFCLNAPAQDSIARADRSMYANRRHECFYGSLHVFKKMEKYDYSRLVSKGLSMQDLGKLDAKVYYYKYIHSGAATGAITSFATPIVGIFPAILCSARPPSNTSLNYPDAVLMENSEYAAAYKYEAYRIKRRKIWVGFWIGTAVSVSVAAFLAEIARNSALVF